MKSKAHQIKACIEQYTKTKELFVETYSVLSVVRDNVKEQKYTLKEMVNIIQAFREMSKFLVDLKREVDGLQNLTESLCCAKWVTENVNTTKPKPIRTHLATGSPKVSMRAKLPKLRSEPEAYYALMEHLGVSREVVVADYVRLHWPSVCEHISELAEKGEPLPKGVKPDETYPVYSVAMLTRGDIDEVAIALKSALIEESIEKILKDGPPIVEDEDTV